MKKIMTLLIVCVLMGLKACVDDNGNYDYLSQDLVTIAYENTGTGANITCVEGTELVIEPIITWKNPSDSVYFEYTWIADNDTISHDKVLRYTFPEIKDYYLLFYVYLLFLIRSILLPTFLCNFISFFCFYCVSFWFA